MKDEKAIVLSNALQFIQKARVAAQVRLSHLEKKERKCELTNEILNRAQSFEDWLNGELKEFVKSHPAYPWFSKVKGIGDLNIGKILSLIDIEEASQISKLWRYAGFGCDGDGKAERRVSGEKLHYNSLLKTMCWRLMESLIRAKGAYYDFYLEQKEAIRKRLEDKGMKIIPSEKLPKEKGKRTEQDGFFALGHLNNMARRKMIKLFLSHLWLEWRKAEGLEVTEPYVHAVKGHTNFRNPDEFIS